MRNDDFTVFSEQKYKSYFIFNKMKYLSVSPLESKVSIHLKPDEKPT